MEPHRTVPRRAAASVDPHTIQTREQLNGGAEVLIRRRGPGSVQLHGGQKEHLLMCTRGRPVPGTPVSSVLSSQLGDRRWSQCPVDDITFVPAGFPMEWEWSYASDSIHLVFDPRLLAATGEGAAVGESEARPLFRVPDNTLQMLMWELKREVLAPAIGGDLALTSLLSLLLIHLHRQIVPDDTAAPPVAGKAGGLSEHAHRRSLELLSDRLAEAVSLAELARACDLSPSHFARQFKHSTGVPPHEYQLRLRIARALEILKHDRSRRIADLACELGFTDESHFRRHFKRLVGTTPAAFRNQQ